jgi:phenylalanyl-tRNA synthetase beta chain
MVHGADNVPAATPAAIIVPGATDVKTRAVESCRDRMIGLGFSETMHYSFLSDKLVKLFKVCSDDEMVVLPNPVSADHSIMRPSLIPQMVESMGRNIARQITDLAFFEMGRVFHRASDGAVSEEDRIVVGLMGNVRPGITGGTEKTDPVTLFLALKGAIERLCAGQRVVDLEFVPGSASPFEDGSAVD